jgi:hypothetical protein
MSFSQWTKKHGEEYPASCKKLFMGAYDSILVIWRSI